MVNQQPIKANPIQPIRTSGVTDTATPVVAQKVPKDVRIAEIRAMGRKYCQTDGSEHYKAVDDLEPIDLIIAKGQGEGFCIGNVIKYATRFIITRNLNDLRKAADYVHIACGIEIFKNHPDIYSGGGVE